ncbi:hypothetical protein RvY_06566 [Ramazzottius varieornatus]|uniref:Anaphase-promoting complex subunit 4 n=1 Tax=Ramazzottius varieornatus TaxID=947166 RepID=A0A1D1UZ17_RAMVA|nr:hypothetical protein RvY_06566 [Ramazzottius varieornatus]
MQMKNQRTLSILSVVTESHSLHLYAFGFLPLAFIDLSEAVDFQIDRIQQFYLSRDFSSLLIILKDTTNSLHTLTYNTSIIQHHFEELEFLAKHYDLLWSYRKIIEVAFKRLSEKKDESRQEMESEIQKVLDLFLPDYNAAVAVRPELAKSEQPKHFLLAALTEQLFMGTLHPALEHFFDHAVSPQTLIKYQTGIEGMLKTFRRDTMLPFRQALESCMVSLVLLNRWVANEKNFKPIGAMREAFEKARQDCSSFFLKMFEVQYVAEKEAKRCLTTVSWLINQMETLNPPDQGATSRSFSERDLDSVISVFQDLFGRDDEEQSTEDGVSQWRMYGFGVDDYFLDQDLRYPLDPHQSDFQPYYDTLTNNIEQDEERGFIQGPFLGDLASIPFHPPRRALFAYHRTKTAKQELTAFNHSLELAFSNIATVISQDILLVRKTKLDRQDGSDWVSMQPCRAEPAGKRPEVENAVQICWSVGNPAKTLVVERLMMNERDGEGDLTVKIDVEKFTMKNTGLKSSEIVYFQQAGAVNVIFLRNSSTSQTQQGGENVTMAYWTADELFSGDEHAIGPTDEIELNEQLTGANLQPNILVTTHLGSMMALVTGESRLRLFRFAANTKHKSVLDDTDKIAEELRLDLNALPA